MKKFLWGAVLGSVAALLYTKKTGKEMREEIADKFLKTKESTDRLIEDINETQKELRTRAKIFAYDAKDAAEHIFKEVKKEGKKALKQKPKRKKKK